MTAIMVRSPGARPRWVQSGVYRRPCPEVWVLGCGWQAAFHLVRGLPRGEEGRVCVATAVAGGRFCRNLRIRADPTPPSTLCTQCPRRSGAWALTRSRVALVLILRLRHVHETGPADRR